jgi:HK97 family phage major capsid protein
MEQLNELGNLAHAYRKELARIDASGRDSQHVDTRGHGEEREKFARMDADLSAIESAAQDRAALRAAQDRIKALENAPQYQGKIAQRNTADIASEEYSKRWLNALVRGDAQEMRVLTNGTTAAPVPTDMERRIVTKMFQSSVLRQMAKINTIDSKRTLTVEGSLPTSAIVAENGAITAADPTFAAISINPIKFVCATTMSMEYLEDAIGTGGIGSGFDYIADRCGISLAKIQDQYFTIGSGVAATQPQGIGDTSGADWAGANTDRIIAQGVQLAEDAAVSAITGDNLIDCVHAVPPQYRVGNFKILTSDAAIKAIRKIKVNTTDYVWKISETAGLSGGNPGTILGIPYMVGEYVPSVVGGTTSTSVRGNALFIAGNFDYFEIFDRKGIETMLDPYSGAANQRSTLYVHTRTDSKIMQPEAFAAIYTLNAS